MTCNIKTFLSSFLAGIAISIGCICYVITGQAWVFAIGLLTISIFGLSLFTGKVPFATLKDIPLLALILIGNLMAAALTGAAAHYIYPNLTPMCWPIVEAKMMEGWAVIPKAILCNVMIFIAVYAWKKLSAPNNLIALWFATTVFIYCGFEHCVANAFYLGCTFTNGWNVVLFMILNILGNALGGVLAYRAIKILE